MPRTPPKTYDVVREQDGALVRIGLSLADARDQCATLNAESRVIVRHHPALVLDGEVARPPYTEHASMYLGEVCRYEIKSQDGLVIR